ncbi:MAG: pyridoxamine 5'-phosphate oxidase family protein [Longimicrobiales bacterium]|nr:pyridoxamine 5'-phosphate oxidase family protein [Longimicrobiales bacterium]
MNPKRILRALGPSIMALGFLSSLVQGLGAQTTISRDTLLAVARDIIGAARYCGLVTLDESGTPRVRTMDPFAPEEDMTIWMGTNRNTRKVQEIELDSRVTLFYHSPDAVGYVTITGRARLVDDAEEKNSRWKAEWEGFYEDRASDYILIQVTPERIEVIDYSRGIVGDAVTWTAPSVEFLSGG